MITRFQIASTLLLSNYLIQAVKKKINLSNKDCEQYDLFLIREKEWIAIMFFLEKMLEEENAYGFANFFSFFSGTQNGIGAE